MEGGKNSLLLPKLCVVCACISNEICHYCIYYDKAHVMALLAYLLTMFISSDTEVDAIDVCLNGHFLVVCEKNGNMHLIYVPHKRILLTRVCVLVYVISVIDLLLSSFCLLVFVFYLFLICTFCRLWCRSPLVWIRKHTTISSQKRANHRQVMSH